MDINNIIGLTIPFISAQPVEIMAAVQGYVNKVNTHGVRSLDTITNDSLASHYELDVPEGVKSVLAVYEGTEPIPMKYNESDYVGEIRDTTELLCYVDRSKQIRFNHDILGLTIKASVIKVGSYTITTLPAEHEQAAAYFALYRLFSTKYKDKEQAATYLGLFKDEYIKLDTNEIDITDRYIGDDL